MARFGWRTESGCLAVAPRRRYLAGTRRSWEIARPGSVRGDDAAGRTDLLVLQAGGGGRSVHGAGRLAHLVARTAQPLRSRRLVGRLAACTHGHDVLWLVHAAGRLGPCAAGGLSL